MMNAKAKRHFVQELIRSVQSEILDKLSEVPEEWDGFELRWMIADYFDRSRINPSGGDQGRQRKREYRNEVLVRNLV